MKEKITQHSILLFEEKGFVETSVQDIVETLGVTKGTFYYYFTSKEQLLMEIHLNYINRLLERQRVILESAESEKEKISQVIRLLIADIASYGPSARVFFREVRHLGKENAAEIRGKRERFRLNIKQMLQRGKEKGEFREDMEPGITAFAVLGITNWSYQWYNPAGEISPDQLSKIYTQLILQGIE